MKYIKLFEDFDKYKFGNVFEPFHDFSAEDDFITFINYHSEDISSGTQEFVEKKMPPGVNVLSKRYYGKSVIMVNTIDNDFVIISIKDDVFVVRYNLHIDDVNVNMYEIVDGVFNLVVFLNEKIK